MLKSRLKEKAFFKNIAFTFSGGAAGIVLQFVFTPVIARIYDKADYGGFAIFQLFVFALTDISTLAYSEALILPKKDSDFVKLAALILLWNSAICILLALTLPWFGQWIMAEYFAYYDSAFFLNLVPVALFLTSLYKIVYAWSVRQRQFGLAATANVGRNLSERSIILGFGYFIYHSPLGLVLGGLVGQVVNILALAKGTLLREFYLVKHQINLASLRQIGLAYIKYPRYMLPSQWLNTFSDRVPVWVIGVFFASPDLLGAFAMAIGLLQVPFGMLANSIRPVFLQHISKAENEGNHLEIKAITERMAKLLSLAGALPMGFLMIYGKEVTTWFLGAEWESTGIIASLLALGLYFQLVSSPLASVRQVKKKEERNLLVNILLFLSRISLVIFLFFRPSFYDGIAYYSFIMGLLYLGNLIDLLIIVKSKIINTLLIVIGSISISYSFFLLSKYLLKVYGIL